MAIDDMSESFTEEQLTILRQVHSKYFSDITQEEFQKLNGLDPTSSEIEFLYLSKHIGRHFKLLPQAVDDIIKNINVAAESNDCADHTNLQVLYCAVAAEIAKFLKFVEDMIFLHQHYHHVNDSSDKSSAH